MDINAVWISNADYNQRQVRAMVTALKKPVEQTLAWPALDEVVVHHNPIAIRRVEILDTNTPPELYVDFSHISSLTIGYSALIARTLMRLNHIPFQSVVNRYHVPREALDELLLDIASTCSVGGTLDFVQALKTLEIIRGLQRYLDVEGKAIATISNVAAEYFSETYSQLGSAATPQDASIADGIKEQHGNLTDSRCRQQDAIRRDWGKSVNPHQMLYGLYRITTQPKSLGLTT